MEGVNTSAAEKRNGHDGQETAGGGRRRGGGIGQERQRRAAAAAAGLSELCRLGWEGAGAARWECLERRREGDVFV